MTYFLTVILLFIGFNSNGQEQEKTYDFVEQEPTYPGGEDSMQLFIQENIVYPSDDVENGIQGTVYVSFIVGSDGAVSDVGVIRGVSESLDAEAIRVIEAMPNWNPGEQAGKKVRVRFTLPIRYHLTTENYEEDDKGKAKKRKKKKKKKTKKKKPHQVKIKK